jgi:ComF family protein
MPIFRAISAPARNIADLLFPPTCWADQHALDSRAGLSDDARFAIARLAAQTYCHRCGLTTGPFATNNKSHPCARCSERLAGITRTARIGTFSDPLVTLIHRLKFAHTWEIAAILAPFLHYAITTVAEESHTPIDCLIPVPLHWWRKARRGFNQAEELARETAKIPRWKIQHPLKRIRPTTAQAKITAPTARAENVKNAFSCLTNSSLANKHIWLIDDVTTTGATLHAAALAIRKLPKELRPASINAAVVCVTDHQSPPP